jgi:hypothetical protein
MRQTNLINIVQKRRTKMNDLQKMAQEGRCRLNGDRARDLKKRADQVTLFGA